MMNKEAADKFIAKMDEHIQPDEFGFRSVTLESFSLLDKSQCSASLGWAYPNPLCKTGGYVTTIKYDTGSNAVSHGLDYAKAQTTYLKNVGKVKEKVKIA